MSRCHCPTGTARREHGDPVRRVIITQCNACRVELDRRPYPAPYHYPKQAA